MATPRRPAHVIVALAIIGLAGCTSAVAPPRHEQTWDELPSGLVAYMEALNSADRQALALHMGFPGSRFPELDQADPDDIPKVCIDGELDALGGRSVDAGATRIEHTSLDADLAGGSSSALQVSLDIAWIALPDGTAAGRQLAVYPDRVLIEPEWTEECTAAATELYGRTE